MRATRWVNSLRRGEARSSGRMRLPHHSSRDWWCSCSQLMPVCNLPKRKRNDSREKTKGNQRGATAPFLLLSYDIPCIPVEPRWWFVTRDNLYWDNEYLSFITHTHKVRKHHVLGMMRRVSQTPIRKQTRFAHSGLSNHNQRWLFRAWHVFVQQNAVTLAGQVDTT